MFSHLVEGCGVFWITGQLLQFHRIILKIEQFFNGLHLIIAVPPVRVLMLPSQTGQTARGHRTIHID